jgi:hypothetical protein
VVRVHQSCTEVRQRHEFQIGVTCAPSLLERLPEVLDLAGSVALEHADVQGDPSGLRRVGRAAQQGLRPGQPTAAHRTVAQDHQVHARHRAGYSDRADVIAGPPMGGVRAFPLLHAPEEIELEVGGLSQRFEDCAGRGVHAGTLEQASRPRRIADAQRGAALGEHVVDRDGHDRDRPTAGATAVEVDSTPAACSPARVRTERSRGPAGGRGRGCRLFDSMHHDRVLVRARW